MIPENLLLTFVETQFLIKAFLALFLVFYFFFSILLVRQVQIMTKAIKTDLNLVLKFATFVNFAASAIFLILVFLIW